MKFKNGCGKRKGGRNRAVGSREMAPPLYARGPINCWCDPSARWFLVVILLTREDSICPSSPFKLPIDIMFTMFSVKRDFKLTFAD